MTPQENEEKNLRAVFGFQYIGNHCRKYFPIFSPSSAGQILENYFLEGNKKNLKQVPCKTEKKKKLSLANLKLKTNCTSNMEWKRKRNT